MTTPSEELAAVRTEVRDLEAKIIKLKFAAEKMGFPVDKAQMYEIEHRLFILGSRVEMLGRRV